MTELTQAIQDEAIIKLVESGSIPQVVNATFSPFNLCLGDLERVEMAKYCRASHGHNGMSTWWTYFGPKPIRVGNEIWEPGFTEEAYEGEV